jgi:TRAP-type C4-dicarboxylate transport system substrate-binding protein
MGPRILAAAMAGCALLATAPTEAKTVKFTIVGAPPVTVTPVTVTKAYVVPEINKRLAASGQDFKIEWTEAWAQSLATFTETFEAVEEGIAHVGVILKNFEEAKLPLEQYTMMMPFGIIDAMTIIEVDARLRQKIPAMSETFRKYNQVYLAGSPSSGMQMFTKFPITKLEDLKGRKIGASGALGHVIRGTGAVIVTAHMAASYTDIKNGVYEGYPIAVNLAFPYKTFEAAPYYTGVDFGAVMIPALTVNAKAWNELPDFARKIFQEVANEWAVQSVKVDDEKTEKGLDAMKKAGVKFSTLPAQERKRWAMAMPNVAKDWADELEKKGEPARAVVKAYMDEVRVNVKDVVRHWDRE